MNLRDLTKKYGRNKGIDIKAVQLFTYQLMVALRHLKKNKVLHADIKPDNILINHRHNKVSHQDTGPVFYYCLTFIPGASCFAPHTIELHCMTVLPVRQ
jgi:serine/threonine-protein kinase PRP4